MNLCPHVIGEGRLLPGERLLHETQEDITPEARCTFRILEDTNDCTRFECVWQTKPPHTWDDHTYHRYIQKRENFLQQVAALTGRHTVLFIAGSEGLRFETVITPPTKH